MRAIGILLLFPWMAMTQVPSPENAALVRGVLLECDARPAGEFSIRAADNRVLRYQFDRKTYVEREERLIETMRLAAGEKVEVLSDVVAGISAALRENHPRHTAFTAAASQDAGQAARLRPEERAGRPRRKHHICGSGFPFEQPARDPAHARGGRPEHSAAKGHAIPGRRAVGGCGFAEAQHARLRARGQGSIQRSGSLPGDLGHDSHARAD